MNITMCYSLQNLFHASRILDLLRELDDSNLRIVIIIYHEQRVKSMDNLVNFIAVRSMLESV